MNLNKLKPCQSIPISLYRISLNKAIAILQNIRRRLKYFFSDQRKKQDKIDKLFKTRKK